MRGYKIKSGKKEKNINKYFSPLAKKENIRSDGIFDTKIVNQRITKKMIQVTAKEKIL